MKTLLIYSFSCCLLPLCVAQSGPGDGMQPPGSGSYSKSFADVFSLFHNQAALAQLTKFTAGVYAERRFMLQAAAGYAFGAALPVSKGVFGFSGAASGYEALHERRAGLAYAMHLGGYADIGLQLDYLSTYVHSYGDAAAVTAETGITLHFSDHWHMGIHAFNPFGTSYAGAFEDAIPVICTAGAGYEPSGKCYLQVEANWDSLEGVYASLALQYRIAPAFAVQSGFSTDVRRPFLGVQLFVKTLRIDMAASYHPYLGFTPSMGILYLGHESIGR